MALAFNWTITLGDILMILSGIVAGVIFAIRVGSTIAHFGDKLVGMEQDMADHITHTQEEMAELKVDVKGISSILITMARQDERINFIERRLNEMGSVLAAQHNTRTMMQTK